MKRLLYWAVGMVARAHNYILHLNDAFEYHFSDKTLHFLVIGLLGMALVFLLYPLFRYLARRQKEFAITGLYVLTVILGLTFAIEIGQKITGTGSMEFADIVFGVVGFLCMYGVFALVRMVFRLIFRRSGKKPPARSRRS